MTLSLAATNTIQGVTTAAATAITYTIFGDEVSATTNADAFKVLAQGQLPTSAAALYTVPASTATIVKTMVFTNTTAAGVTFTAYVNGSAAANSIGQMTIPPNGEAVWTSTGWNMRDANGATPTTASLSTTPKDINGTAYVSLNNPQGWAGTDVGGWINSAWAYLKSTYGATVGGVVEVGPGVFNFSTPIELGTQFAAAALRGKGASSGFGVNLAGTTLNFTATSGIALTVGGGSNNTGNIQLEGFSLVGTGIANTATALMISDATTGSTSGNTYKDIAISQFGTGVAWRNSSLSYAATFLNCKIQNCTNGLIPQGENNVMLGGLIGGCTTGINCNTAVGIEMQCVGVAFDDQTTTAVNIATALARVSLVNCRFENPSLTTTSNYVTISSGFCSIISGGMQDDNTTGTATGFIQATGGTTFLAGTWLWSGGRTFTQAFNVSSAAVSFKADPVIGQSSTGITQLYNIATGVFPRGPGGSPQCNVTPVALTTTAATNVDSRGGLPMPANVRPGFRARATVHIQATATGTIAHTLSIHYGTANTSADATVFSTSVGGTVSAVAASAQYVIDVHLETAALAWAYLQTLISGVGALGNANQDLGLAAPAAVTTTSASFLGVYLAAGTANALTIRSVTWEILSN
jgi:hypothetical protein